MGDGLPLSDEILSEVFSQKFKLQALEKYDETSDPISHLANFCTIMLLQNINNFILYSIFPKTLIGLAQKLHLSKYLSRFNVEAMQIENLNHKIACKAIKKGSRNNRFVDFLIKNPKVYYEQLMERARKYIRLDNERTTFKEERHAS
ncbi:hypothetical protein P3X46_014192 [Hevea brasiliensis]|uniref:Uncharacterized protein n=1 Tax=Hevea brasiliensis TaxID=3981 RepID=A0ABQ9M5W9_HEVBR|nr:hypothetical protein P3X46_014192 [Hevea brasiliensis]